MIFPYDQCMNSFMFVCVYVIFLLSYLDLHELQQTANITLWLENIKWLQSRTSKIFEVYKLSTS